MDTDCSPEFYQENRHVAKKVHKCVECGLPIASGVPYISCRGKWDGDVLTNRQHEECYDLCRYINMDIVKECVIGFGALREWIDEYDYRRVRNASDKLVIGEFRRLSLLYAADPEAWLKKRFCYDDERCDGALRFWLDEGYFPDASTERYEDPLRSRKGRASMGLMFGYEPRVLDVVNV